MYRYEIIRIKMKGIINVEPKEDYREIIKEKAKDGWRLVQIFAPSTTDFIDIIFEKES